jgi:hypothetical protein
LAFDGEGYAAAVDTFEAGRRQVILRLARRLAEAIRRGEPDVIDLCGELLHSRRHA